jgi:hypothetical protein
LKIAIPVVALVVVVILTALPPTSLAPVGGTIFHTSRKATDNSPAIEAAVAFGMAGVTTGTSPTFTSTPGDTLVAFFSILGKNEVGSVKDSVGDTFLPVAYVLQSGQQGNDGMAIWAAYDVVGGPAITVTARMTSEGSPESTAVEIVDATGVAAAPLDQLGAPSNSTALTGGESKVFSNVLVANATDLVLAGVASRNYDLWSPAGGDTLVQNSVVPNVGKYQTVATFMAAPVSTQLVWSNGTSNKSAAWIADSLTLKPLTPPAIYELSFNETNLPAGTLWAVSLYGTLTPVAVAPDSVVVSEPNGTYPYSIGPVTGWAGIPSSGQVTITGKPVQVNITFSVQSSTLHPIQHVVVILLENEEMTQVWKSGPYQKYLAATYGNDSGYYAACHGSLPNYLALVSAVTNECDSETYYSYSNTTLGDALTAHGFTWAQYAESLSQVGGSAGACANPGRSSGLYVQRHVPLIHFANVTSNAAFCKAHILDATQFNQSVADGTMANYSFYTPNLCDDGHNYCGADGTGTNCTSSEYAVCTRQADTWLKGFLGPMLNGTTNSSGGNFDSPAERAAINHTAFIVLWDEGAGGKSNAGYAVPGAAPTNNTHYCSTQTSAGGSGTNTVCGGRVYLSIVSHYSLGLQITADNSAYSVAATVEWLFNLSALDNVGQYDSAYYQAAEPGFPILSGLFSFASNEYT